MNSITDLFNAISPISKEIIERLNSLISQKNISIGESYLRAGQTPRTMGYVKSGLFRYFYCDKNGVEYTKGFFPENNVLISFSALVENRESYFSIQALENSTIEQLNYVEFCKQFSDSQWFKNVMIAMMQKAYCIKEERERQFLLFDAEQRYKSFFIRFPGLDKRVKQHMIASYLGIAPESLSRIRKNMAGLT
jgi:CRP-like cAMP-binding protein